ncbi:MAG: zinc ribbon domain-containing protein [Olsenella sp.]|nr:zinc ribbon domain-containing protein [Olsenella sp.]
MKCSNCGYELQEGMKFCPECGMRVKGTKHINAPGKTAALGSPDETHVIPGGASAIVAPDADRTTVLPHEVAADIASEATQALPRDVAADIAADAAEEGSVPSFLAGAKEEPEAESEPAEEEAPASEESGKTQAGSRKVTVQRGPQVARIHIHVPEGKEAPAAEEAAEEAPAQETAVEEAPAEEPVASEEAAPAAPSAEAEAPAAASEELGEMAEPESEPVPEPLAEEDEDDWDDEPTGALPRLDSKGAPAKEPELSEADEEALEQRIGALSDEADRTEVLTDGMDEELASHDVADIPEAAPVSEEDATDENETVSSPVPLSPVAAPHRHLHAGVRRMEASEDQLHPIDGYVSWDSLNGMDEALEDERTAAAVQEPDTEKTGVLPPAPVVRSRSAKQEEKHAPHAMPVAIAVLCVCAVVAIVAFVHSGALSGTSETTEETTSEQAATTEETSSEPQAALPSSAKSFSEYSASELAGIAQAIEKTSSRDEALSVAEQYGICNEDGTVTTEANEIALTDGTTAELRVADIYTDDMADGGKAGITFLLSGSSLTHAMNTTATDQGGWESSALRSWLSSDAMDLLPDELATYIVPVEKMTNNTGYTVNTAAVTATEDSLWIPSFVEVYGTVNWNWESSYTSNYNTILGSEGTQYAVFSESGVTGGFGTASEVEAKSGIGTDANTWWTRTSSPSSSDHFRAVSTVSGPYAVDNATQELGVVVGFCY